MREIRCDNCGRLLFKTEKKSDGAAGVEAQSKGFIFKMPFLYTAKKTCTFFCNKECCKQWFRDNVSKEESENGNKHIAAMRKDFEAKIPQMQKDMSEFVYQIRHLHEETKKGRKTSEVIKDPGMERFKNALEEVLKRKRNNV